MSDETRELKRLVYWHDEQAEHASDQAGADFHADAARLLRRVATILAAPLPPSSLPPLPPPEDE